MKSLYIFITSGNCQTTDVSQPKINHWSLGSLITGRGEAPLTLTEIVVINLARFGQLKSLALWKQQAAFLTDHWVRLQGSPKGKWIPRRQASRSGKQVVQRLSSYTKQIIFLNTNSQKLTIPDAPAILGREGKQHLAQWLVEDSHIINHALS